MLCAGHRAVRLRQWLRHTSSHALAAHPTAHNLILDISHAQDHWTDTVLHAIESGITRIVCRSGALMSGAPARVWHSIMQEQREQVETHILLDPDHMHDPLGVLKDSTWRPNIVSPHWPFVKASAGTTVKFDPEAFLGLLRNLKALVPGVHVGAAHLTTSKLKTLLGCSGPMPSPVVVGHFVVAGSAHLPIRSKHTLFCLKMSFLQHARKMV